MRILFFTTNRHKFEEAQRALSGLPVNLVMSSEFEKEEVRADDVRVVALHAAAKIRAKCQEPFIVEDSGLYIDALNGFPGAYSSWVLRKLGLEGVLRLLGGKERSAKFVCALAFSYSGGVRLFTGVCAGRISEEVRGQAGFGFDPIFIPSGHTRTFAEDAIFKSKCSHRVKAFNAFATWLREDYLR